MHLIIGGSGFIGTNLCRILDQRGEDFRIVDLVASRAFPDRSILADIRDLSALRAAFAGIGTAGSTIVHLAAVHRDDVRPLSLYDETNVMGTSNLCTVAAEAGIARIIFTSSVAVYGFAPEGTDEGGKIAPFNDYGRTKAEGEAVLRAWQASAPDLRALTIIRPTVVFGPGNRGNVYNFLYQVKSGRFLMIGDGRNRKSMAFVGNVAAFLAHGLNSSPGLRIVNYVDKPDYAMNDLVAKVRGVVLGKPGVGPRLPLWLGLVIGSLADGVARLTGRNLPISRIRVKKFTSTTAFGTAAHETAGFTAPYTLEEGLQLTLDAEFISPTENAETFLTE